MTNQTATLAIEFSGDLADSLRAIANLVEEYGPAFLSDPTAFYGIHNDGAVHRVDIDVEPETCEHTGMTRDELESICGVDPAQYMASTFERDKALMESIADKEIVCKRRHLVDSDSNNNDMERYAEVGDKGKATWDASTEQWSVVWERNEAWGFYTQEELDAFQQKTVAYLQA